MDVVQVAPLADRQFASASAVSLFAAVAELRLNRRSHGSGAYEFLVHELLDSHIAFTPANSKSRARKGSFVSFGP